MHIERHGNRNIWVLFTSNENNTGPVTLRDTPLLYFFPIMHTGQIKRTIQISRFLNVHFLFKHLQRRNNIFIRFVLRCNGYQIKRERKFWPVCPGRNLQIRGRGGKTESTISFANQPRAGTKRRWSESRLVEINDCFANITTGFACPCFSMFHRSRSMLRGNQLTLSVSKCSHSGEVTRSIQVFLLFIQLYEKYIVSDFSIFSQ